MDTSQKFVVVAVYPSGGTHTRTANALTREATTLEAAIAYHRDALSGANSDRAVIHGMPLADFIEHATPEKRDYKVTRVLTQTVTIYGAESVEDARKRALYPPSNTVPTDNCEITNVEVLK